MLYSLALRLLGDVANGGSLLADDGSNVLCGYQQSQRDVGVRRFGWHPRARGPTTGPATRPISRAPTVIRPALASVQLSGIVGNVGDVQGVVLKLVSIQLLDGSEKDTVCESESQNHYSKS